MSDIYDAMDKMRAFVWCTRCGVMVPVGRTETQTLKSLRRHAHKPSAKYLRERRADWVQRAYFGSHQVEEGLLVIEKGRCEVAHHYENHDDPFTWQCSRAGKYRVAGHRVCAQHKKKIEASLKEPWPYESYP